MSVCLSSASRRLKTKWSFAIAIWRGRITSPPVISLKVWIANGAVPSDAGRRSAYTRRVAPGRTMAARSVRCAQRICSVDVRCSAVAGSGQRTSGERSTDARNSARPTLMMPPERRISSSCGESALGSYVLPRVSLVSVRVSGSRLKTSPSCASSTAARLWTTWRPRLSALRRKMSPMAAPQTMTTSWPASSPTPLSPAGLISRELPIAKRSPATMKFCPRATRSRKSGMRYRNEPAFQRSSRRSRLSEMQSVDGVIWSVSIASSLRPGTLGSQKMSAWPRITPSAAPGPSGEGAVGSASTDAFGLIRAGWMVCTLPFMLARAGGSGVGTGRAVEAVAQPRAASRRALASPDLSLLVFGGLTLASVPVRLQGGPASALGYWVVAGVLGFVVVGIYHVRRDRSLALTARPGRGTAYAIVGLTTLVLLVAGAALALANGIGPLIAVSLGLLFLASLERRREYAALAMLLAVVAVAPVTLLPQPDAFVVSTLAFGAVLTAAGALLFRSRA